MLHLVLTQIEFNHYIQLDFIYVTKCGLDLQLSGQGTITLNRSLLNKVVAIIAINYSCANIIE